MVQAPSEEIKTMDSGDLLQLPKVNMSTFKSYKQMRKMTGQMQAPVPKEDVVYEQSDSDEDSPGARDSDKD